MIIFGPIIASIATEIVKSLIKAPGVPVDQHNSGVVRPEVERAVKEAIATNPVLINEMNAEPPSQSRVVWGSSLASLGALVAGAVPVMIALGFVTPEEGQAIIDGWGALVPALGAVVALGGALYSLYGRLAKGLAPLFAKRT